MWTVAIPFVTVLASTRPTRLRATHAPSPDVRCAHPGLRSLDADCAPASMPPPTNPPGADRCPSNAGSRGTGSPKPPSACGYLPWEGTGLSMPQEPGYGSKRSQDGEAQRTCRESRPGGPRRTSSERAWVAPSRRDGLTQVENLCYGGAPSQVRRGSTRPASAVPNRIALRASAHSMLPALRHPCLRWSARPAPGARATARWRRSFLLQCR